MASLTGQTVSGTYESLIKLEDNTSFANGDSVALTDGVGNPIGIEVQKSLDGSNLFVTITAEYLQKGENFIESTFSLTDFQNGEGLNEFLTVGSDTITNITFNLGSLNTRINDLENGVNTVKTLNDLFGDIDFINGTNTTVVVDNVNKTIQIDAVGGGGGGSDSFNTFTVPTQPDVVADSGNDTMNFVDGVGISMTTDNTTKTITFSVDANSDEIVEGLTNLYLTTAERDKLALLNNNGLPDLAPGTVWLGASGGIATAVNENTLNVATAFYADEAADVKVDSIASGTYRIILGESGQGIGAYQRLYSNAADGFTYNVSGGVVSAGAFTATNNVTAGGALSGASLDISGNADIDGTLQLGGIGNVEGEINQNASDIAALQAIPQYAPVVTETASFIIEDNTYEGKFVVCNSSSVIEVELEDSATYPANVGDEIYFMQQGTGQVQIISLGSTTLQAPGNLSKTRTQYSTIGIKYLGSNVWVAMGDLGV